MKIKNNKTGAEFYVTSINWRNRYSHEDYSIVEPGKEKQVIRRKNFDRNCISNGWAFER